MKCFKIEFQLLYYFSKRNQSLKVCSCVNIEEIVSTFGANFDSAGIYIPTIDAFFLINDFVISVITIIRIGCG